VRHSSCGSLPPEILKKFEICGSKKVIQNEARSAFAVGEKTLSFILARECPYCGSTSGLFVSSKNFPPKSGERAKSGRGRGGRKLFAREPQLRPAIIPFLFGNE